MTACPCSADAETLPTVAKQHPVRLSDNGSSEQEPELGPFSA